MTTGTVPILVSGVLVCDNPVHGNHGNMVNWDPLISQVLDLPEYNTVIYQNTRVLVHLYTNTRVC